MDDLRIGYCTKCLDDHEERIRGLEADNKKQEKFYLITEKLDTQIRALDEKTQIRFRLLEKYMETTRATSDAEHHMKTDSKADLFSIIALVISVGSFVVLLFKVM
jgi:hypothetical protein